MSALVSAATALSSLCACLISCSPVAFADSTGYLNCLNTSIGYSGSTDSALSLGRIAYNAIQGALIPETKNRTHVWVSPSSGDGGSDSQLRQYLQPELAGKRRGAFEPNGSVLFTATGPMNPVGPVG